MFFVPNPAGSDFASVPNYGLVRGTTTGSIRKANPARESF